MCIEKGVMYVVSKLIGKERLFLDGALGTVLQRRGLKLGEIPELFNFTHPEVVKGIHKGYLEAGSDIISANTFGANRYKISKTEYSVEQVIMQAVGLAKEVVAEMGRGYVALDIGSTGKLIEPIGDVGFEEVYEVFKEEVLAGVKAGCDVLLLETFTDLYELKAAVLAAKENSDLPIICTMSFEPNMRTFFGTSLEAMVLTMEGLGVDALGINCSLGPKELEPIVEKLMSIASIPVAIQPNAGLPVMEDGVAKYNITSDEFVKYMKKFAEMGVSILGGCCGTDAEYIEKMIRTIKPLEYVEPKIQYQAGICSSSQVVRFDDVRLIGERLNPTGKKLLREAIKKNDLDYILKEAIAQKEEGAHILDVNMGLPDIDEPAMLMKMIKEVQAVVDVPLQIDSSDYEAIEKAARIYNGKPLINSVNAKPESLAAVLPIAKKYGAAILGLTLDEKGIPATAQERLVVARRIVEAAEAIGIRREDIFIDCLVVTASAQQELIKETLEAVKLVKQELGVKTVLGVSNVSFGLPNRPLLNKTMLTMALMQGLDAPILNTKNTDMLEAVDSYRVLMGLDLHSEMYIEKYAGTAQTQAPSTTQGETPKATLKEAIVKGLKEDAKQRALESLETMEALMIIEKEVIPALNEVGDAYEKQILYLPQLIKSAEAAKSCFEVIKEKLRIQEVELAQGPKVVVATVYGDIHDIGKNIVKVIMENYGFQMIDLGRDVAPETILEAVRAHDVKLVGLSALMTTTVSSMQKTIALLNQEQPDCKIVVGGAVLTPDLAKYVGADYYAKDAMDTVKVAQGLFGEV